MLEPHFWIVRTKGWALSMKKAGTRQRVLKGLFGQLHHSIN